MSKETRDRIAFRMQPETRRRIEQWYAADNCQSKNEFIEKAVNFYVDYLGIPDGLRLQRQQALHPWHSRWKTYVQQLPCGAGDAH